MNVNFHLSMVVRNSLNVQKLEDITRHGATTFEKIVAGTIAQIVS